MFSSHNIYKGQAIYIEIHIWEMLKTCFAGGSTSHGRPHLWQEGEWHIYVFSDLIKKIKEAKLDKKGLTDGRNICVFSDLISVHLKVSVRVNAPPGGKSGAFW